MNANLIKLDAEYAVSKEPRKGTMDLYDMPARRVRVMAKGVKRWAPHAGEDGTGMWILDGIRGRTLTTDDGRDTTQVDDYKPRDFLMPWSEYRFERDARQAEIDEITAGHEREKELVKERVQKSVLALEGLGLKSPQDFSVQAGVEFYFDVEGIEKLTMAISERIYEAIRDAT